MPGVKINVSKEHAGGKKILPRLKTQTKKGKDLYGIVYSLLFPQAYLALSKAASFRFYSLIPSRNMNVD